MPERRYGHSNGQQLQAQSLNVATLPEQPEHRGAPCQISVPHAAARGQHGRHARRGAANIGRQMSRAQRAGCPLRRF
eukprot:6185901-Pyramimonas_sp.AAC.1